jgi:uncharacterized membrane protein
MKSQRPVLNIPKTFLEKLHDLICIFVLIVMFAYLFFVGSDMPEKVPIHFNAMGEADGWGSKWSLIILLLLGLVTYIGLSILGKYPHVYNYLREITERNAPFQYLNARMMVSWLKVEIVALMGYLEWTSIQLALGRGVVLGKWFLPISLMIIFGTILFFAVRSFKK